MGMDTCSLRSFSEPAAAVTSLEEVCAEGAFLGVEVVVKEVPCYASVNGGEART